MTAATLGPIVLVALACGLDRLLGDPRRCLHPVVVMGWLIDHWRRLVEAWAGDQPWRLRLGGLAITVLLVGGSGLVGWGVERLAIHAAVSGDHGGGILQLLLRWAAALPLPIALASALAGRSLEQAVRAVLAAVAAGDLPLARQRLSWIVGRDTENLDGPEILRAAAETASENGVDGLFAPLFWMLVGAGLWCGGALAGPGPLALAWGFKAASTLDSMLGYRRGRLAWLGTAGARLDDLLTWLPCRLVALGLPLAAARPDRSLAWFWEALKQGASDPSPNAGVSQAAYALAAGVRLGGTNRYADGLRTKPLLAPLNPAADGEAVQRMLRLSTRLELIWLSASGLVLLLLAMV